MIVRSTLTFFISVSGPDWACLAVIWIQPVLTSSFCGSLLPNQDRLSPSTCWLITSVQREDVNLTSARLNDNGGALVSRSVFFSTGRPEMIYPLVTFLVKIDVDPGPLQQLVSLLAAVKSH